MNSPRMYSINKKSVLLNTDLLLREYLDVELFIGFCRRCNNYGKKWSCPDLQFNALEKIGEYDKFLLRMITINYDTDKIDYLRSLPVGDIKKQSFHIESRIFNNELLQTEESLKNAMAVYSTTCILCAKGSCTRPQGKPCRHPETMRVSLEAMGINVTKLVKDLFCHEILWEKNDVLPEYYTLAGGVFFNEIQ